MLPYIFWFLLGVIHLCLHLFPVSYSRTTKKNDNLPYTISVLISLSFRSHKDSKYCRLYQVLHLNEARPRTPSDRYEYPRLHCSVPPRRPSWKVERSVALYHQRSYLKRCFLAVNLPPQSLGVL